MKKILISLILINLIVMPMLYLFLGKAWFVNAQVAFLSASLVMFTSMFSYARMVQKGLNTGLANSDDRDTLDKLEDPYDLYDEQQEIKDVENADLKEVVAQERANLKKNRRTFWQSTKDVKASFSFYRLGAYAVLVLGFFYLNTNDRLLLLPYLLFLSLPPIIIVLLFLQQKDSV